MSNEAIDIKGLDYVDVLRALHGGTRALGMGAFHDLHRGITSDEIKKLFARELEAMEERTSVDTDYIQGRPIKVKLEGDQLLRAWLYDRDAGEGACQRVIDALKAEKGVK